MRTSFFAVMMVLVMVSGAAMAAPVLPSSLKGVGHLCSGDFTLTDQKVSWNSVSASCPDLSYRVIKKDAKTGRTVLKLDAQRECPYAILVVSHEESEDGALWSVTGYPSEQDFAANDRLRARECFYTSASAD